MGGGSETHVIECSLRHRDGTWLQFEVQHTDLLQDEHVRGIVLNGRDVSERKAFEDQLAHQAFHDPVTSLANRALFADRVQHSIMRSMPRRPGDRRHVHRPRRLQDRQRQPRPRGRRHGPAGGGAAPRGAPCARPTRSPASAATSSPILLDGVKDSAEAADVAGRILRALELQVRRRRQAGLPTRERRHLPGRPRARLV